MVIGAAIAIIACGQAMAEGAEGVLARCGASKGQSYFLKNEVTNSDGPNWAEDGMSNGKIVLVRLGDEWDIQFDDAVGAFGYRQDEASVIVLGATNDLLTIGAFRGTYTDVYTFDFAHAEVVWTSHKTGTITGKIGLYRAACDVVSLAFN